LTFVLLACSPAKIEYTISDSIWIATEISELATQDSEVYFRILDNRISGKSGCNNFFGNCNVIANTIRVEEIGSTKMMCDDEEMKIESAFINALSVCTHFSINNDSLKLYNPEGTVLAKFVRQQLE
jgi:heat shock protein HslJ